MFLFVYGTLKSHHHNNHYLEDQELIGEYETAPLYRLYCNDHFPMMIRDKEDGYSVSGEIWKVDENLIEIIDDHEALYERKVIKVRGFNKKVFAYIYLYDITNEQECYGYWDG